MKTKSLFCMNEYNLFQILYYYKGVNGVLDTVNDNRRIVFSHYCMECN